MKRIQRLHLRNFKAFRDQVFDFTGVDPNGKCRHVLIYGGNGSGKSSIYWALYTLFEASGKQDVVKYFADPKDVNNPQSLRNMAAPASEAAYVKIEWFDDNPPLNPSTGKPRRGEKKGSFQINANASKSNAYANSLLREGNRASDFVNYRLFQHFNGSNRNEVNVWPAFVRDIFPYYTIDNQIFVNSTNPDLEGAPLTYWEALGAVVDKYLAIEPARQAIATAEQAAFESSAALVEKRQLAGEEGGEFGEVDESELASTAATEMVQLNLDNALVDYQNHLSNFNFEVSRFVRRIATNTNYFLEQQEKLAGWANKPLRIKLQYEALFQLKPPLVEKLATMPREYWTTFLRRDQPEELRITLTANVAGNEVQRPQTFFNEARLTQIAFALRMGALLDRNPNSRFNVLCLDDVLLSLDMSNRLEILDWLFSAEVVLSGGSKSSLLDHYQIVFLTHDQELYELVEHYAKTRGTIADWYCAQLAWHSRTHAKQPMVFVDGDRANGNLERAKLHFESGDYGACGNYLRKATEDFLEKFLPLEFSFDTSKNRFKLLDGLIEGLFSLYKTQDLALPGTALNPFNDLKIYKNLHLNPLSHHTPMPLVMQDELWRYIMKVVPNLERLGRTIEINIKQGKRAKTLMDIKLPMPNGVGARTFRLRMGSEPLYKLQCVVSSDSIEIRRSNPLCFLEGEVMVGRSKPVPIPNNRSYNQAINEERMFSIAHKLYEAIGVAEADRTSIHTITVTAA